MPSCWVCGKETDLQVLEIDHCGDQDEEEVITGYICVFCAHTNEYMCEKHGLKYCAHFPECDDLAEGEGAWCVLTACPECVIERVKMMNRGIKRKHLQFIATHNERVMEEMRGWYRQNIVFEDPDDHLLYAILIVAELHKRTLEQALVDLVTERADRPLN